MKRFIDSEARCEVGLALVGKVEAIKPETGVEHI